MASRIEKEKRVVSAMIQLYCRKKEGNKELCASCKALLVYAHQRLDRCPFGNRKSTCRQCSIHCYRKDMKLQMQTIMRFSGPRMLLYHPIAALEHLWNEFHLQPYKNKSHR